MTTPKYIHDAVIRAWLDGKQVQYYSDFFEEWLDAKLISEACQFPAFSKDRKYRIKPEVIKYKRYVYRPGGKGPAYIGSVYPVIGPKGIEPTYDPTKQRDFVRWIDIEWQEIEV